MIILILIAAFLIRLINLNQSLWLDEAITALTVKNYDFLNIITVFARGDFHPPLYYLVLKLWTNFFGYSEIALRMPSVIFGVLTVFFIYKLGGKKAALFMALNPLAIYYSQEARMYGLAAFAVTAAVYFFQHKKYLLWGLFFLVGLYTDYLVWFMIPVFLIKNIKTLCVFIFLLPLLFLLKEQLSQAILANSMWLQVVGGLEPKSVPMVLVKFVFGRISVGYLAVISIMYLWILASARTRFNWLWLGLPIIIGFIISFKIPVFSYFRFLFVLPAFVLLLAEGVKNKKQILLICLISVISLIYFSINLQYQREDWRGVVNYVQNNKVFMPSAAQDAGLKYYNPNIIVNDVDTISIGQERTVYLLRYVQGIFDQRDFLRHVLELSGYTKTEEKVFNGVVVWKYQI
ncbi:MAG: glycosyltransferase family 39 protein [bacterium]|nr:glycosyltransferase family 39 protein [bacterium]